MQDGIRGARQQVALESITANVEKLLERFAAAGEVDPPRKNRDPKIATLFMLEWVAGQLDVCAGLSDGLVAGQLFEDVVRELEDATKRIGELEKKPAKPRKGKK